MPHVTAGSGTQEALGVGQARLGAAAGGGKGTYTAGDLVQVTAPHRSPSLREEMILTGLTTHLDFMAKSS